MSRRSRIVVVVAAVFVLVAGLAYGPALLRKRTPAERTVTPAPLQVSTMIPLGPGAQACASPVPLTPGAQLVTIILDQPKETSPPLAVTADGPGYRSPSATIESGISGRVPVKARLEPPQRELFGRVCVRNDGKETANLVGTEEFRTSSLVETTVDDVPVAPDMTLLLEQDRSVSVLGFLPEMLERMSAFRGFLGATWLLWPLLVLIVAGVPAAVLYAFARVVRADDDAAAEQR